MPLLTVVYLAQRVCIDVYYSGDWYGGLKVSAVFDPAVL